MMASITVATAVYFDLHNENLCFLKQLKHSILCLMISIRFCLSLTVSQLMGMFDPPQYTQVECFLCSAFAGCGCRFVPVIKEAVGVGR